MSRAKNQNKQEKYKLTILRTNFIRKPVAIQFTEAHAVRECKGLSILFTKSPTVNRLIQYHGYVRITYDMYTCVRVYLTHLHLEIYVC